MTATPTPGDLSARQVIADMQSVAELRTIRHSYIGEKLKGWIAALSALPAAGDSVWMFKDRQGQWCAFSSDKHRENTIASGEWEVRQFFTTPQPSAADDYESWAKQERQREDTATRLGSAAVGAQGDAVAYMSEDGTRVETREFVDWYRLHYGANSAPVTDLPTPLYAHAAPAAGKGVEAHARELLAIEYERGGMLEIATVIRHGNIPTGWKDDCLALKAISAALTRQPVAGDGPEQLTLQELVRALAQHHKDISGDTRAFPAAQVAAETAGALWRIIRAHRRTAPAATPTDGGEGA